MADRDLLAHSPAEAYLYLMVTACPACNKGPLISAEATLIGADRRVRTATIPATCRACNVANRWRFQFSSSNEELNPTDEPSRLIDLAQWVTLCRMITEAAGRSDNRIQARGFRIQAWQCIDEALKFFEPDNALPPRAAFFARESLDRFEAYPEQFARSRLLQLRDRLPSQSPHGRPRKPDTN